MLWIRILLQFILLIYYYYYVYFKSQQSICILSEQPVNVLKAPRTPYQLRQKSYVSTNTTSHATDK